MNIIVNDKQAKLVVSRLDTAFKNRKGLLAETSDLVENQMPEGVEPLSLEHALFLFYVVPNDHGTKSSRLWSQAKKLFIENRDLFMPATVITQFTGTEDPGLIDNAKALGARYPKVSAKGWYLNSVMLIERFAGDPRNLLHSSTDAFSLIKEIKSFHGFGPKTGGMFLRAAIGLGFANVITGLEEVLVPVDIHDSRISFLTGILAPTEALEVDNLNYYDYVPTVQKMLLRTCNELGINWLDTDRALWLIGSRGCVNKRCMLCPLQDICSIGQGIMPLFYSDSNSQDNK